MFSYKQKYFFFLLSVCIISQSYAMENDDRFQKKEDKNFKTIIERKIDKFSHEIEQNKINKKLKKAIKAAEKNNFQEKDWLKIEKYVYKGANGDKIRIGTEQKPLLMAAIGYGRYDFAHYLIESGIDIDARDGNEFTALYKMINEPETFNLEIFNKLLERGANANVSNLYGYNPLYSILVHLRAERNFFKPAFISLLKHGADPAASTENLYSDNPLCYAIRERCANDLIDALIGHCNDVNNPDKVNYFTPLIYAIKRNNFELVQELLAKGASSTKVDLVQGKNAFHFLVKKPKEYIEDFMANICFDFYDPKQEAMLKHAYWILKHWEFGGKKNKITLPEEIRFYILGYLVSGSLYEINGVIARKAINSGNQAPFFAYADDQIKYIKKILKTADRNGKIALEYLSTSARQDNEIIALFDGDQIENNLIVRDKIIDKAQLALRIKK